MSFDEIMKSEIAAAVEAELDRRALPEVVPDLITIDDAAKIFPKISRDTIERAIESPEWRRLGIGVKTSPRTVFINKNKLLRWIDKGGLLSDAPEEKGLRAVS